MALAFPVFWQQYKPELEQIAMRHRLAVDGTLPRPTRKHTFGELQERELSHGKTRVSVAR